ncbi:LysR family transcriptional regulator [Spelaeicoccus albus]|uniref:DNA-binding transcriptional LysR family regulator n=1 Tax=Spelaeicoccus albus TaxID=1280376 RepID=A0A7Z0D1U6_9MICO|nr:LysR family transcriptional regulator [Spelaeicoccus albus]NYI66942.1 DNA-binding transcriptional LysR family regulator [Spelaeicoccus albus]
MSALELNLIRTFTAIYETGSVTEASTMLSVTQPSVSYGLARLRKQLADPLFVRSGTTMAPTDRAVELYPTLSRAVSAIDAAVGGDEQFDPATSRRMFRLCLSDLGEFSFLPAILSRLRREAPDVAIDVVPMEIDQVRGWLRHGSIDAAIASIPLPGLRQRKILTSDRYVCMVPESWAGAGSHEPLSVDEFQSLRHVVIDQESGHHQVDEAIEAARLERRTVLKLRHFAVLPGLMANSDIAAIVPLQVAEQFTQSWPVVIRELPIDIPTFDVSLYWNDATSESKASRWFLELLNRSLGSAGANSGG